MPKFSSWLQSEAPAIQAALAALLALVLGLGVVHLSVTQTGDIEAAVTALIGLVVAIAARPFHLTVLTGFIGTVGTLLVAFHVPHVTPGLVSLANAAIVAVIGLLINPQATARFPRQPGRRGHPWDAIEG